MEWRKVAGTLLCLSAVLATSSRGRQTSAAMSVTASTIIEGEIKDQGGQPLPGASVMALPERGGLATQTTTDRDGRYDLEGLSQGTYRVDVSLFGFSGWR